MSTNWWATPEGTIRKSPLPNACRVPPSMPVPARFVPVRFGADERAAGEQRGRALDHIEQLSLRLVQRRALRPGEPPLDVDVVRRQREHAHRGRGAIGGQLGDARRPGRRPRTPWPWCDRWAPAWSVRPRVWRLQPRRGRWREQRAWTWAASVVGEEEKRAARPPSRPRASARRPPVRYFCYSFFVTCWTSSPCPWRRSPC